MTLACISKKSGRKNGEGFISYSWATVQKLEGYAKISLPGGCAAGSRPVDLHLYAMKKLGANIDFVVDGYVMAKSNKSSLIGNRIDFSKVSVGTTENAIMAAVMAKGETIINNAALEPEIIDLIQLFNHNGSKNKEVLVLVK